MKKIAVLVVSIILMLTIAIPAFAAETATVSCSAADEVKRGETLVVTVSLTNSAPLKFIAITPSYDSSLFTLESGQWLIAGATLSDFNGVDAVAAYAEETQLNGPVFQFVLKAKADATTGSTTVSAQPSIMNGADSIAASVASKTVKVACSTHDYENVEWAQTVAPNCTEEGTEVRVCNVCKEEESRQLSALGHKMGEYAQTKAPTCTEKGEETCACTNEGCTYTETREVEALGHTFGGWKNVKASTCTVKGSQERVCETCKEKETRESALAAHEFEEPKLVKEATLTTEGLMQGKCKNCSEVTEQKLPCAAEDDQTGVVINAEQGTFPEGTTAQITDAKDAQAVKEAMAELSGKYEAYEIAFEKDGAEAEIDGEFTVILPETGIDSDNLAVYVIDKDGVATGVEFTVNDDGTITVVSEVAGTFVVADKTVPGVPVEEPVVEPTVEATEPVAEPTEEATEPAPTTPAEPEEKGNNMILIVIIVVVLIIVGGIIVGVIMRKKKEEGYMP